MRYAFFHPGELNSKDSSELAYELIQVKRDDLAHAYLSRLTEMGKAAERQIFLLVHLNYKMKKYGECLRLLDRIKSREIIDSETYASLKAWSLLRTGKFEECRAYIEKTGGKFQDSINFKRLATALAQRVSSSTIPSASEEEGVKRPFHFVDVTAGSGLTGFRHVLGHPDKRWILDAMGSGVAVGDYDSDGDDDIYFVSGRSVVDKPNPMERNALFRNDDGHFVDVTDRAGVGDTGFGMSAAFGDFNNDGRLDLFVGNYGANVLYLNNGDGTFTDYTEKAGVGDEGYIAATSLADVDHDGDLDLFVGNYVAFDPQQHGESRDRYHGLDVFMGPLGFPHQDDRLYVNTGEGIFKDAAETAAINVSPGRAMGSVFFDFDNDGDLDLYVTNDSTYNHMLQNRGDGTFEDISFFSGGAFTESGVEGASMGVIAGDYNNDGHLDLFITSYEQQSDILFKNDGKGALADVTGPVGLLGSSRWLVTWGSGFCDFDADGRLDIFTANGHIYPQIEQLNVERHYAQGISFYRNTGERFQDVTKNSLEKDFIPRQGRGAAQIDFDSDGDMDIVINCIDTTPQLLENRSPRGHWLQVTLDGPSARTYGVRVVARKDGRIWTRIGDGGSGYLSQSSQTLHFGFGETAEIDDLTVYWFHLPPQTIISPPLDRRMTVRIPE